MTPRSAGCLCKQGVERWYSTYAEVSGDIKLSGKREKGTDAMSEIRCCD